MADSCEGASLECRADCRDAILTWRTSSGVCEAHLDRCLGELGARTATSSAVLRAEGPTGPPSTTEFSTPWLALALLIASLGGVALGYGIGRR